MYNSCTNKSDVLIPCTWLPVAYLELLAALVGLAAFWAFNAYSDLRFAVCGFFVAVCGCGCGCGENLKKWKPQQKPHLHQNRKPQTAKPSLRFRCGFCCGFWSLLSSGCGFVCGFWSFLIFGCGFVCGYGPPSEILKTANRKQKHQNRKPQN